MTSPTLLRRFAQGQLAVATRAELTEAADQWERQREALKAVEAELERSMDHGVPTGGMTAQWIDRMLNTVRDALA